MKLFLTNQKPKFNEHIEFLKTRKVMSYELKNLKEKITSIDLESKQKITNLNLDFLFNYQIFPDFIMSYLTQWESENRKMQVGDTILQQVYLPPIKKFSQKVIFGVRICKIIDKENIKGFSYETLEGHVEKGISTFTIEIFEDKLIFKINTFSSPGNFLTRLLGPIISVPYQTYCTKCALKNVKRNIQNFNNNHERKNHHFPQS